MRQASIANPAPNAEVALQFRANFPEDRKARILASPQQAATGAMRLPPVLPDQPTNKTEDSGGAAAAHQILGAFLAPRIRGLAHVGPFPPDELQQDRLSLRVTR
jgi:hypothetical protein